jgi:hypothetical protein
MALLAILLLLFGFVFAGLGFGASSASRTEVKPVVKCSKRMAAKPPAVQERHCGPPPAKP